MVIIKIRPGSFGLENPNCEFVRFKRKMGLAMRVAGASLLPHQ